MQACLIWIKNSVSLVSSGVGITSIEAVRRELCPMEGPKVSLPEKIMFCRFEHPSWSSLFLWQGHITIHVYDVIKHVEGSRVEDNQILSLKMQGKSRTRKEDLILVGLGVVIGFSLYVFLLPILLGLVSLYKGSLEAENRCHTIYTVEPLHKHKL